MALSAFHLDSGGHACFKAYGSELEDNQAEKQSAIEHHPREKKRMKDAGPKKVSTAASKTRTCVSSATTKCTHPYTIAANRFWLFSWIHLMNGQAE